MLLTSEDRHKAQIISKWLLRHDSEFASQSPDLNPTENIWDVMEQEIYVMDVETNRQRLS